MFNRGGAKSRVERSTWRAAAQLGSNAALGTCRTSLIVPRLFHQSYGEAMTLHQSRRPTQLLPKTPARTRFAPSPTGHLHLGSLRTALYNYLLAKVTKGQFLLRIEDTDTKRTVPGAEDQICRDLEWAGLHWDEGPKVGGSFGPYRQSERTSLYKRHANDLIHSGHAYRCFCSTERLKQLSKARREFGMSLDYDRACASISRVESNRRAAEGESYTIRFKSPDLLPEFTDMIHGQVGKSGQKKKPFQGQKTYEDPIILKSDGLPTYHLANVVDDQYMMITHVIRAAEWMSSTPKHLAIYEAFGWKPPTYAHVGLLQDASGQKLSKRNMDVDVQSFREEGIFPEALVNHVALLGWSHKQKSDFLSLDELIESFDLKFTKGNTIVNFEKLAYLQKLHAQRYIENDSKEFGDIVERAIDQIRKDPRLTEKYVANLPNPLTMSDRERTSIPNGQSLYGYISSILKADSKQYRSPHSFFMRNRNFFVTTLEKMPPLILATRDKFEISAAVKSYTDLPERQWLDNELRRKQEEIVEEISKRGSSVTEAPTAGVAHQSLVWKEITSDVMRYLRWAIMAAQPGPPMAKTMELLGRHSVLSRLVEAENRLKLSLNTPIEQ